ncbi:MAG: hypothetical protein QGH33_01750 [Pirellulaceae bacterium]|nr:hypothetical protein [Pirellulaceae bacterium]MDP7303044.1 hypothetical protein [Pirellulaceae bacterium]HJN08769.1 hypothetical protein [Pirellulaceae bacterium]
MRVPRIPVLLLTATCCLSGCCSFNGTISTDHAWVSQKGGTAQKGAVVQKGAVAQKGAVVQKGHVHQKGYVHQKGVHQKGAAQKSVIHRNLWNRFEPSACHGGWDPVLGSCEACGVCGGACQGHTPAQHLKHTLTCASGCGEIYWGEWISHPPDDCDPCDDWGNWIGPTNCDEPSCLDSLASGWCNLFGYRNGGGKGKSGCDSCGGKGGCDTCGGVPDDYYDAPIEDDSEVVPTPEIEASYRTELLPRAVSRFSIRSARLTR